MHQDPYFKTEKRKREPIPIRIIESGVTKPTFKIKRVIGSVPCLKESESQTDTDTHSKYIQNVLTRKESHDHTFGVYQDETHGCFIMGRSSFKYNDKHVFVDGKKYKTTYDVWELPTQSRPEINLVFNQHKKAYKQITLQSNAHRVKYSISGKIKANKCLKYTRFISQLFTNTQDMPWESLN